MSASATAEELAKINTTLQQILDMLTSNSIKQLPMNEIAKLVEYKTDGLKREDFFI